MSEKDSITMSKQEFGQMMDQFLSAMQKITTMERPMTPLEKKKYDDELEAMKRREAMQIQMAKTQMEADKARKEGCSHCRWPATAGKKAGHSAPKGQGEWVTQAQMHGENIGLVCQRCAWTWLWGPASAQERQFITDNDGGMAGFPPPPDNDKRLIWQG